MDTAEELHGLRVEVARLSEQVRGLRTSVADRLAPVERRLGRLEARIEQVEKSVEARYVTSKEFEPVKRLSYGLVAALCMGVLGALLKFVVAGGAT